MTLSQLRAKHGYVPPEPEETNAIQQIKDTAASTVSAVKQRGSDIKETFQEVAAGDINPIQGAIRTVGSGIGAATDVLGGAVVGAAKAVTPAFAEKKIGEATTAILNTSVGKAGLDAIRSGVEAYNDWKSRNEGAAKDLEAVVNIASIFPVEKALSVSGKAAVKGTEMAAEAATGAAKKVLGKTPEQIASKAVTAAGEALQPATKFEAAKGAEGLMHVDLTDVKDYAELAKRSDDAIKKMSEAVDVRTDADPTPYMRAALGEKSKFIDAALDDMESVYTVERYDSDSARISALRKKFEDEGLTNTEINHISREYGTTFKNKAFNKDGKPKQSWSGAGYENTRNMLKDVSRGMMPDEATKNLDEAMSKVYVVKQSAEDLSTAAMKLENKIVHPNVLQKFGGLVGTGLQVVGVRDFIKKILPGLVQTGDMTMNVADLEKRLAKTLGRVQKLKDLQGKDLTDELISLANEAADNTKAARAAQKALPEGPIITPAPKDTSGAAQMSKEQAQSIAAGKYRPPNVPALPAPSAIYAPPYKGARPTVRDIKVFDKIKAEDQRRLEMFRKAAGEEKEVPYR
jgi:hypothetical protein